MTASGGLHDDEGLIAALRDAFDSDLPEVPPELSQFSREAFRWTVVDGELARLSPESDLTGVRGPQAEPSRTFESSNITIDLHFGRAEVVGWIRPPQQFDVTFVSPNNAPWTVTTDVFGRFSAEVVLAPPFRLIVKGSGDLLTITEWTTS
jgi:hypothetical protein